MKQIVTFSDRAVSVMSWLVCLVLKTASCFGLFFLALILANQYPRIEDMGTWVCTLMCGYQPRLIQWNI